MPDVIISDTSCLIILSKINELEILKKLYGQITTTPEVAEEFGEVLPLWIRIKPPGDKDKQQLLELQLDKGESSVIALAMEADDSLIILDDHKARKIADRLRLKFTGTIGIIVKAKIRGIIPSVKPILAKIKETNFWISKELEEAALKEAKE